MGRIQANIGLVSGIPISDTVDQLLQISGQRRDLALRRGAELQQEQTALSNLATLVADLESVAKSLASSAVFDQKSVASSDESLLVATVTGNPVEASYQLTPLQLAQHHQLLSDGFADRDQPIGSGAVSISTAEFTLDLVISATDTLDDLAGAINQSGENVAANVVDTGSGPDPYRLMLVSGVSGAAGALTATGDVDFEEIAAAQDAQLRIGPATGGVVVSSATNTFDDVIDGLSLTVRGESATAVTVTIEPSSSSFIADVESLVERFNTAHGELKQLTSVDPSDGSTRILFGSAEALRVESALAELFTAPIVGAGAIKSLEELGVSVDSTGQLVLDADQLAARFAAERDAVKEFFTTQNVGFADKASEVLGRLVSESDSLLPGRVETLRQKIDSNQRRVERLEAQLERERQRLLQQFFDMEAAIARLQASLTSLQSIQPTQSLPIQF